METHVAWIDDVHVLTVNVKIYLYCCTRKNQPVIYWAAKEKYFSAKVEEM